MLKYASNTTNMWFHLQTHHHREYAAIESQERARPASSGSSTTAGSSRIQPTLVESIKSQTSLLHTSHHWKNITVNHQLIALVFCVCAMLIHGMTVSISLSNIVNIALATIMIVKKHYRSALLKTGLESELEEDQNDEGSTKEWRL